MVTARQNLKHVVVSGADVRFVRDELVLAFRESEKTFDHVSLCRWQRRSRVYENCVTATQGEHELQVKTFCLMSSGYHERKYFRLTDITVKSIAAGGHSYG